MEVLFKNIHSHSHTSFNPKSLYPNAIFRKSHIRIICAPGRPFPLAKSE